MCNSIPINLAVEDDLSEYFLRTLLDQCGQSYEVGAVFGKQGYGFLKNKLRGFNNAANHHPYILLTDLDRRHCATELIEDLFKCPVVDYPLRKGRNLLLFIAFREVETWLMADREAFASFLRIRVQDITGTPEQITDPKEYLIGLARKSKNRLIREDIVPLDGSLATKGPDYNGRLAEFLLSRWRMKIAMQNSPSLARAVYSLQNFRPQY